MDVKTKKVLIIAGTHQREIKFSHPVVDILLDGLKADKNNPDEVFVGVDGATRASVWDSNPIAIAKLYKHSNGEPTLEWLRNQPLERLVSLAEYKAKTSGQDNPPRIAETFGGEGQWTSVHDPIIQKYAPLFFIDLHSYNVSTVGQEGRGMQINSYSNKEFDPIMINALSKAQSSEAQVYGYPPQPIRYYSQIRSDLLPKYFTKEELIEIIRGTSALSGTLQDKLTQLEEETQKVRGNNIDGLNENGWYFVSWGKPEPRGNYYLFEAKHWQRNQQEATAKFIIKYLIPEVSAFGK